MHDSVQGDEEREREEKSAEYGPMSAGRSATGETSIFPAEEGGQDAESKDAGDAGR